MPLRTHGDADWLPAASARLTRGAARSGYMLRMNRELSPFLIFDGYIWRGRNFQEFRHDNKILPQTPRLVARLNTPPPRTEKPNYSGVGGYYGYLSKLAA